jgi:hypothetical protein
MKIYLVIQMLGTPLLHMPFRRRLAARSSYPGLSRIWTRPGPLRRLAWLLGFGPSR